MPFVSHDRTFLRGLSDRALELDGRPLVYGEGYAENVEQAGREAPGIVA